ncbi:uncharacterized protein PV09_08901 [Verruconis gallopava]|uniref:Uncharacterized protein n=1 Tax=Verruconis gallopava TaxID=253628 RepID=A0A0D1YFF3_9PEZI|nr:uncharacterized protein PV09_08901 [Verruconis gallopava]KIV99481.1 hypothetical protein PV09_08901 [Verruconis gallopava]
MSESSRGRGKKVIAPRGRGRRSQAERDQIAAAERERNRERDAAFAREQNAARLAQERAERDRKRREAAAAARGRGRGRGGFMGESHIKNELSGGPLSDGSIIGSHIPQGKAFPRPWAPSNRSGVRSSDISTLPTSSKSNTGSGLEFDVHGVAGDDAVDGGYISSDLEDLGDGPRVPIEAISLLTDDEDEDGAGAVGPFGAPVRLNRVEHRARAVQVTADAEEDAAVKTEDGDVSMTDVPESAEAKGRPSEKSAETTGERPWRGVWQEPEPPAIKEEPNIEEPDARAQDKIKAEAEPVEPTRRTRKSLSKAPGHLNEEERNEFARELQDNEVMLGEFGNADAYKDQTRTYVFQFPPVLPNLCVPNPITIKDDPDAPPEQPAAEGSSSNKKSAPIKIEDGDASDKEKLLRDQTIRPEHLPKLAPGAVGKLRVHKSGRVTMDWGGSSLVVQNGVLPKFLQTLVMVKMDEESLTAAFPGAVQGMATAFGQPRGKLVVQPDWDDMLDNVKGLKIE